MEKQNAMKSPSMKTNKAINVKTASYVEQEVFSKVTTCLLLLISSWTQFEQLVAGVWPQLGCWPKGMCSSAQRRSQPAAFRQHKVWFVPKAAAASVCSSSPPRAPLSATQERRRREARAPSAQQEQLEKKQEKKKEKFVKRGANDVKHEFVRLQQPAAHSGPEEQLPAGPHLQERRVRGRKRLPGGPAAAGGRLQHLPHVLLLQELHARRRGWGHEAAAGRPGGPDHKVRAFRHHLL